VPRFVQRQRRAHEQSTDVYCRIRDKCACSLPVPASPWPMHASSRPCYSYVSTFQRTTTTLKSAEYAGPWPLAESPACNGARGNTTSLRTVHTSTVEYSYSYRLQGTVSRCCHRCSSLPGPRTMRRRGVCTHAPGSTSPRPCILPDSYPKFYCAKRRFSITSKYRHMHEVLNIDEIKN
jgi:hypothetical protein